jgi:prophage regulatory protein
MAHKILRLASVKDRIGWSRSTIYAAMARGSFPKPISLGPRSVGWLEADIEEWLTARIAQSRTALTPFPGGH